MHFGTHFSPLKGALAALCVLLATPHEAAAQSSERAEQQTIWHEAAKAAGVSVKVMYAMALQESGRKWTDGTIRPWPWTLNSPQRGPQFFWSKQAAADELGSLIAAGASNIDIGAAQVNCKYHCWRVSQPADLLDVHTNLRIASQVLREAMEASGGDIATAVGIYHAGTSAAGADRAIRYRVGVANRIRKLNSSAGQAS